MGFTGTTQIHRKKVNLDLKRPKKRKPENITLKLSRNLGWLVNLYLKCIFNLSLNAVAEIKNVVQADLRQIIRKEMENIYVIIVFYIYFFSS